MSTFWFSLTILSLFPNFKVKIPFHLIVSKNLFNNYGLNCSCGSPECRWFWNKARNKWLNLKADFSMKEKQTNSPFSRLFCSSFHGSHHASSGLHNEQYHLILATAWSTKWDHFGLWTTILWKGTEIHPIVCHIIDAIVPFAYNIYWLIVPHTCMNYTCNIS